MGRIIENSYPIGNLKSHYQISHCHSWQLFNMHTPTIYISRICYMKTKKNEYLRELILANLSFLTIIDYQNKIQFYMAGAPSYLWNLMLIYICWLHICPCFQSSPHLQQKLHPHLLRENGGSKHNQLSTHTIFFLTALITHTGINWKTNKRYKNDQWYKVTITNLLQAMWSHTLQLLWFSVFTPPPPPQVSANDGELPMTVFFFFSSWRSLEGDFLFIMVVILGTRSRRGICWRVVVVAATVGLAQRWWGVLRVGWSKHGDVAVWINVDGGVGVGVGVWIHGDHGGVGVAVWSGDHDSGVWSTDHGDVGGAWTSHGGG